MSLERSAELISNPLFRFLNREITTGSGILTIVRKDLIDSLLVVKGQTKPTNQQRKIMKALSSGEMLAQYCSFLIYIPCDFPY